MLGLTAVAPPAPSNTRTSVLAKLIAWAVEMVDQVYVVIGSPIFCWLGSAPGPRTGPSTGPGKQVHGAAQPSLPNRPSAVVGRDRTPHCLHSRSDRTCNKK